MTDLAPDHTPLDPLADLDAEERDGTRKNYAKVGSARPPSLMYTYGPGSLMDLPHFTIVPAGLDDWYSTNDSAAVVDAPRLLAAVRILMDRHVKQLLKHPWIPDKNPFSREGSRTGVPARVFPQWLRCTGCDMLAPLTSFHYSNTNPYRPDKAEFLHGRCPGRKRSRAQSSKERTKKGGAPRSATPARYLLACSNGHLDEFPYVEWVHEGGQCPRGRARLFMIETPSARGSSSTIRCETCDSQRSMREAQGSAGESKLPQCRGRHPHLGTFDEKCCDAQPKLLLIGASNLWFPSTTSIIAMPKNDVERTQSLVDDLRSKNPKWVDASREDPDELRELIDIAGAYTDAELLEAAQVALNPVEDEEENPEQTRAWNPIDLLVPEYEYLQKPPLTTHHGDDDFQRTQQAVPPSLSDYVDRVYSVEKLRKVNALVGFTRIDEMDRVGDLSSRMVPLTRRTPYWTVVTEDRGEGIYIQLSEDVVHEWEKKVEDSELWRAHLAAHERNFNRRFSETAKQVHHTERMRPARYWLLHTFSHVLLREMAMHSGYASASLSERIYAWEGEGGRMPASGVLICTTASDSDGTLGGLVSLSEPATLERLVRNALRTAQRCSSDPVCTARTPQDPEDFLHGAACHNCSMASETSCERANRFLDRRFLINLPGAPRLGFFDGLD